VDARQEEKLEARRKKWNEILRQGIWMFAFKTGALQWGGVMSLVFIVTSLFPVKSTINYWVYIPAIIGGCLAVGFLFGLFMWWVLNSLHKRSESKNSSG
jgi:uncharacterized membrane protein